MSSVYDFKYVCIVCGIEIEYLSENEDIYYTNKRIICEHGLECVTKYLFGKILSYDVNFFIKDNIFKDDNLYIKNISDNKYIDIWYRGWNQNVKNFHIEYEINEENKIIPNHNNDRIGNIMKKICTVCDWEGINLLYLCSKHIQLDISRN